MYQKGTDRLTKVLKENENEDEYLVEYYDMKSSTTQDLKLKVKFNSTPHVNSKGISSYMKTKHWAKDTNIIIFQDFDFNKYLVYDYNTETIELCD